jgi:hypothetical protein
MRTKAEKKALDHSGSTFASFLEEEGMREEVEAVATKRVLAWQLSQEMGRQRKTKQAMARELQTSRSQLDRLLDPQNISVSLDTMSRAARALGKSLVRLPGRDGVVWQQSRRDSRHNAFTGLGRKRYCRVP